MAYIGRTPQSGNFQVCDAIAVVDDQAAYTMQVGSVNVVPESANNMIVSLNGVIQAPISSYTVSGSTITFASNLVTGDSIDFIQILGDVLNIGTPSDSTVSLAKLTASGTKNSTTFLRGDNTFAAPSGGKILQVVTATDSTERTTTSSSFVTASNTLSVDITPSSTSSKIFIICNTSFGTGTANQQAEVTLYRDSTNLGTAQGLMSNIILSTTSIRTPGTMTILDSPSSTSEITYQLYCKCSGGTLTLNWNNTKSSITAFEIGA